MQIALKAMAVKADYSATSIHAHRPLQLVYHSAIAVTDTCFNLHVCVTSTLENFISSQVRGISLHPNDSYIVRVLKQKCRLQVGMLCKMVIKLIMRSF